MLLGGVASRLQGEWKGKRLAVVLAGALDYLPFAALPIPGDADGVTLASEFEVVELPSASVLAAIRTETSSRPRASRAVAVVADPVFDRADVRVGSDHGSVPARRSPRDRAVASEEGGLEFLRSDVEGHDEFAVRSGYARLPFTRREADAIASLVAREDVFEATDFQASRPTVLSGALQGYRIVHFATHGVLDDSRPALSGLILSLVDQRGNPQDGFLRLHDIYNTRVDADLVVLSACQTALGKQIRGEGLVGLARAFMYAGAPRVVASLWEVSDVATAELMRRFYRNMLQQNLTPAAALRSAQLEIAKKPQWRSPYYWAGFVLQGDWR
jgi:CHAT domain-containing protein